MRDADDEIREIKTEIIESRALIIKTNNLTNSLAADIKAIGRRQLGDERRLTINSAVAYVLFATLSFVGLKLWSDVRVDEIGAEKREQARQLQELRRDLEEQTRRSEKREQAETKAAAFYELIRKKDFAKVVEGYDDIKQEPLTKTEAEVFRDSEAQFRLQQSMLAYQNGLNLTRAGRYADAVEQLQEAMRLKDDAPYIPAVKLELARDLLHLNRPGEAALLAQEVIDQTLDKDIQDDGAWILSQAAEDLGNAENARAALRMLQRRWPHSSLFNDARKRLNELKERAEVR